MQLINLQMKISSNPQIEGAPGQKDLKPHQDRLLELQPHLQAVLQRPKRQVELNLHQALKSPRQQTRPPPGKAS